MTSVWSRAFHRREHRQVWAVPVAAMEGLHQIEHWLGLTTIVMVKRVRHLWNKVTREVMVYLSSRLWDAAVIGRAISTHWGIENQLHWVLDVTWGEDQSRIRRGHGGENMALLRRLTNPKHIPPIPQRPNCRGEWHSPF